MVIDNYMEQNVFLFIHDLLLCTWMYLEIIFIYLLLKYPILQIRRSSICIIKYSLNVYITLLHVHVCND